MLYLNYNEPKQHGTRDFPAAFYHVDINHPRYDMPFHWHKEFEIALVISGCFRFLVDNTEIIAHTGESVFIPSGAIHGGMPEDCVYECLVFDMDMLFIHADSCRHYLKQIIREDVLIPPLITNQTLELQTIIHRLFSYMSKQTPGYELMASGCLLEMFGTIFSEQCYDVNSTTTIADNTTPYKRTEQIKSVFEYIENNYSSNITLLELSQLSGMSPKYFCRYFQTLAHRTPMDYLNYYRIERSCSLLCTTDLPITSIAYDCGFNDCSYFIKTFRKYKHTTPKQYQIQMKQ